MVNERVNERMNTCIQQAYEHIIDMLGVEIPELNASRQILRQKSKQIRIHFYFLFSLEHTHFILFL